MLDLRHRALGLGFLVASGVTTMVHRKIFEVAQHGPAQLGEPAIGLPTFMLASAGILLLINGSRLFAREIGRRPPAYDDVCRPSAHRQPRDAEYGSACGNGNSISNDYAAVRR